MCDSDCEDFLKIMGIGVTGASASDYFGEVANDIFPARLLVSEKDDVADLQAKILNFIVGCDWLFVITDIEDLELAERAAKIMEDTRTLITFIILCPSADDGRLADIPENFGTWIILPEDKIAESGLTKNTAVYRAVYMVTGTVMRYNLIGMDFGDVIWTIKNGGRACIGFGESLDAENAPLVAVKKALKSPLFIEEIGKAKQGLLVFVGRSEFISMLEMNAASSFLDNLRHPDLEPFLWQVCVDETFGDGVATFVLATDFDK